MKKTNKKGFTMVELVIVIAVIAILAAVLIPTFISLTRKANEATALAEARNMANQLLSNLLERGEQAKDLVVIQQKSDGIYVHAYSVEEARVVAYKGNPIDPATLTEAQAEDEDEKSDFEKYVDAILSELQSQGAILPLAEQPTQEDWWHPEQMKEIAKTLEFDTNKTCFRADFKVIVAAFEEKVVDPAHECDLDNLTHFERQEPTCSADGFNEYWMCPVCGKLYIKNEQGAMEATDTIPTITALGHDWEVTTTQGNCQTKGVVTYTCSKCGETKTAEGSYGAHSYDKNTWKSDASNHWHECTICHEHTDVAAHDTTLILSNDGTYAECPTCQGHITNLPADVKEAVKLNTKLSGQCDTMYDAFCAVADISDKNAFSTNKTKIDEIITQIQNAEKGTDHQIVWDQTINKFVVARKSGTSTTVLYTYAGGTRGTVSNGDGSSNLWDTYSFNELKDSKIVNIGPDSNDFSSISKQVYSIYYSGNEALSEALGSNGVSATLYVGFDMGCYTSNSRLVFKMLANYTGDVKVRTTFQEPSQVPASLKDNEVNKIELSGKSSVHHYGYITGVMFAGNANNDLNYYEHGSISGIRLYYSYMSLDNIKYTFTFHIKNSSFDKNKIIYFAGDYSGEDTTKMSSKITFVND